MAPLPRLSRDTTPLLPSSQQSCAGSFSVADSQWGHDLSAQEFHDSTTCSLSVCKNPDQCDSKDCCKDADCLVTLDSADRPLSAGNDDPEFDEYSSLFNHDQQDPLSCQWLLPGQPCAVSPPTLDALSDHVYHDHIQPQTQQLCQWNKCNDVVDPQELVDHLSHDHHLDAYVCLWQDCKAPNFSSSEALDEHIKLMHTKSFDCHWGGCEVANNDPGDLTTHVYQEHLNISTGQPLQYPNPSPHTGSSYNSNINSRDQTPDIPITSSNTTATSSQDANEASNLQIIHKCMWELGTGQSEKRDYCGESIFGTENDLQKHVEEQHTNEKSALGRGKGDGYICKWHNCARGKNLLRDRFSLNRHLYKHTGCM